MDFPPGRKYPAPLARSKVFDMHGRTPPAGGRWRPRPCMSTTSTIWKGRTRLAWLEWLAWLAQCRAKLPKINLLIIRARPVPA